MQRPPRLLGNLGCSTIFSIWVFFLQPLFNAEEDILVPNSIHGVPPNLKESYIRDFPNFYCQSTTTRTVQLPFTSVNDNYCDCEDGSDEPGTSACSHLHHISFYCPNHAFKPKMVKIII